MRALPFALLPAATILCAQAARAQDLDLDLTAEVGMHAAEFEWTEAEPSWQSVLEYRDIAALDYKFGAEAALHNSRGHALCLRGRFAVGWITAGENRDTDFADGAMENQSVSELSGELWEYSVDVGGRVALTEQLGDRPSHLTLRLGYAHTEHNFADADLHNTFPFEYWGYGDVSTYDAVWKGPYVGVDFSIELAERLELTAGFEGQLARYEGLADWMLREDFAHPSFEHTATGMGVAVRLGASYRINDWLSLGANASYQSKWASDGTSFTWFADGTEVEINLEEVKLKSSRIALGLAISL